MKITKDYRSGNNIQILDKIFIISEVYTSNYASNSALYITVGLISLNDLYIILVGKKIQSIDSTSLFIKS